MLPTIIKKKIVCSECGETGEYTGSEVVCPECGMVLKEQFLDRGALYVEKEERTTDVNPPKSEIQKLKGLGTKVGSGKYSDVHSDEEFKLLWNDKRTKDVFCSPNLSKGLHRLKKCCSKLDVPRYFEEGVAIIFRKLYEKGWTKGRDRDVVLSGLIMVGCRKYDIVRTPREIAEVTSLSSKGNKGDMAVLNSYKEIAEMLDMGYQQFTEVDYTKRLCDEFDFFGEERKKAISIAKNIKESKNSCNPRTVASAVVYVISRKKELGVTQKEIAEQMSITPPSIRNKYEDIADNFGVNLG